MEFVRQEPKKRNLSDRGLVLDLPILFTFGKRQLLLWLVEFQEDTTKFSIYKLLRYTTDLIEGYPKASVIPAVLFADRKKWRKSVLRQLETKLNDRLFLHFEYVFVKLFDFKARDYYNIDNPVVKILLPKMDYAPEERHEVIRRAYAGLYRLASAVLFDKYVDFIDLYARIDPTEREKLYREFSEKEDTAMLAQYIKDKGRQEGRKESLFSIVRNAKKQGLSEETISKIVGLDADAIKKILNREDFEVPLHLLDSDREP